MTGVKRGYSGLIKEILFLLHCSVADIFHRGGTILRTARSDEFLSQEGRKKPFQKFIKSEIEGLIVIGGDGPCKELCTWKN